MADNAKKRLKPAGGTPKTQRAPHLEDALRANLAKRKAQARARKAPNEDPAPTNTDEKA